MRAQLKIIKEIFEQFDIQADGFTHAGRKAAVQHGEIIDVEDAQIRQLGHWDTTWMAKHYSSGIARRSRTSVCRISSRSRKILS